ncbi:MAG: penicillin-binding protein 1B [Gammaproteobacteria bacterium]|nr:penicillin-binding protein 1B [Gammaproteobacteria bacterium]
MLLLLVGVAAVVYLDFDIRAKFEGKRWALPAHLYSRPLELYEGQRLNAAQLVSELKALGYRQVSESREPGSYAVDGTAIDFVPRPFVFWDGPQESIAMRARFSGGYIDSFQSIDDAATPTLVRLEPRLFGSISPVHHEDRSLISLDDAPDHLIDALLVIEDRSFFKHHGIDPKGLLRATVANIRALRIVQGGSTLTQQLVKNLYLTADRTLQRKLAEMVMAVLLDFHYDKEQILQAYLNEVYLGQAGNRAIHGFGLASYFYFGRPLRELRVHEVALLVGMVRGPSFYNPRRQPERARERRDLVLDDLARRGYLSAEQSQAAKRAKLGVTKVASSAATPYPAFTDFVRRQLLRDYREEDLRSVGLRIFTTLDPFVQEATAQALQGGIERLESQHNLPTGSLQGAVIVGAASNGELLAIVGDRNPQYAGFNRALDAVRPVGSILKPAVYLTALERPGSYTLATLLQDEPLTVKQTGSAPWSPQNYDGLFHGQVNLVTSLANSYNVATARLGMDIGVSQVKSTLSRLGLRRNVPEYPALLLGGTGLTVLEIAQMYQTFANGGFRAPMGAIRSVLGNNGQALARYPLSIQQVVDPGPVHLINYALQQVVHRGTARGLAQYLPQSLGLAGKTGTTDGFRDSWFAGFNDEYVAVVWLGRDDNQPIDLSGASGAMTVWGDLMRRLNPRPLRLSMPPDVEIVSVDPVSGGLADSGCDNAVELPFIIGSAPRESAPCLAHQVVSDSPDVKRKANKTGNSIKKWFEKLLKPLNRERDR